MVFEPSMMSILFDDADAKSREIIVLAVVHARHFGGFAAHQRATCLHAAIDDAGDDAFTDIDVEFPGGKIVEKKQRLRALERRRR